MEETKEKVKVYINPPPSDKCCEVCGKHIHDLKPFGGPGDPLVGDFNGQLLVKTFRAMGPKQTEWDVSKMMVNGEPLTSDEKKEYDKLKETMKIVEGKNFYREDIGLLTMPEKRRYKTLEKKHYNSFEHLSERRFIRKYGKEELERFWFHEQISGTIGASWECRDCICLGDEEYFKKKWKQIEQEDN